MGRKAIKQQSGKITLAALFYSGILPSVDTREKLLSYLSEEAKKSGRATFSIPFNRQLADYLSVERSAMSAKLCKLRDEGVLEFHKNRFTLL